MQRKYGNKIAASVRNCSAAALLATLATGCGGGEEDLNIDDASTSSSTEPLWLASGVTKWSAPIPVCFNTGFTGAQQSTIRRAITDSWGRVANVHFFGWGACPTPLPTSNHVIVHLDPSIAPLLGQADIGKKSGANAVRFVSGSPSIHTIIHEFGHTLGFLHEHSDTTPTTCNARTSGGNHLGTQADVPSSIMSQSACNSSTTLSAWDIVGVQNAYGRRLPGSMVGVNAQCLDLPAPSSGAGQNLQVYDCNGGGNQRWRRIWNGTLFAPSVTPSTVDVEGGSSADGTAVQVFTTNSPVSSNQIWNFNAVEIRGIGNLCLDIPNASVFSGQFIQTFPCAGGVALNQRWNVDWPRFDSVRIRSALNSSFCIQAPAGAVAGSDLTLATCDPANANQEFFITTLGELRNQGLCWDSEFGDVAANRRMQLFTCALDGNGKRNQQYFLRGNVTSGLGKCLTTNTTDFTATLPAQIATCSNDARFIWDYYFNP